MTLRILIVLILCCLASTVLAETTSTERAIQVEPAAAPVIGAEGNWAVVVGVNKFADQNVSPLTYAEADARSVYEELVRPGGLVPPEQAYLFVTSGKDKPTRENVLSAIKFMVDNAPETGLVMVYLSSHGFIDDQKRSYVMPENGMKNLLEDTALSVARLQELLSPRHCKANKKLVIVDACRNAPLQASRGGTEEVASRFREELSNAQGEVVMVSCGPGEVSYEDEEFGHGVYTHFLLKGLRGEAPCDEQGFITVSTLGDYLSRQISGWCKQKRKTPVQNPWMEVRSTRSIPLAGLPKGATATTTSAAKSPLAPSQGQKDTTLPPPPGQDSSAMPPLPPPPSTTEPQPAVVEPKKDFPMEMLLLEGGSATLGQSVDRTSLARMMNISGEEGVKSLVFHDLPQKQEGLSSYWIGKYEVTQGQWREVAVTVPIVHLELNPSPSKVQGDTLPVENVSLADCKEFCARLTAYTGKIYRLPTEQEWEFACRAGSTGPFSWGEKLEDAAGFANCADKLYAAAEGKEMALDGSPTAPWEDGHSKTAPVGSFKPNGLGLFDMTGNVSEWCEGGVVINNSAPNGRGSRVFRGASWGHGPLALRSSFRAFAGPKTPPSGFVGFRVARNP
jgi:formylglycine-generating enzyme required for sulfatase activity